MATGEVAGDGVRRQPMCADRDDVIQQVGGLAAVLDSHDEVPPLKDGVACDRRAVGRRATPTSEDGCRDDAGRSYSTPTAFRKSLGVPEIYTASPVRTGRLNWAISPLCQRILKFSGRRSQSDRKVSSENLAPE
jgi:hypothetical protein